MMKRKQILWLILCSFCLLFSACSSNQEENNILEEIRSAPVVKLEFAEQQSDEPIFADNTVPTETFADLRIQTSDDEWDEEWIYRFTYNPKEKVINGHEIIVQIGLTSASINGVVYIPEEDVDDSAILEWAEGVYKRVVGEI